MGQKLVLIALGAFVGSAGATAGELPNFEKSGLPTTQVHVSVLDSADLQEQASIASLVLQGCHPHRIRWRS